MLQLKFGEKSFTFPIFHFVVSLDNWVDLTFIISGKCIAITVKELFANKSNLILNDIHMIYWTECRYDIRFSKLSKELNKISNKYRYKCSFINTSKLFVSHNVLNTEFYTDDGLHLNPMGACKLAGGLWAALRNIFLWAKKIFTLIFLTSTIPKN